MKITDIHPDDLDRNKLSLISLGSLCGMGIGFIIGFILPNIWFALITGLLFLGFSGYSIFKNIHLLT